MAAFLGNSPHARDIKSLIHSQTNLERHLEVGPTIVTRGDGVYVYDDEDNRFLEGIAGLWCASLGFNLERLARVAYEQMSKLGAYHVFRHNSNEPVIDLAEKLLEIAPVPMSKTLFQCSGSEANDTAAKIVWYYHNAIGKPEKRKIIGRYMGYHGSTAVAVSLSGKPDMHADFNLPFPCFLHTDMPHFYRYGEEGESEEEFSTRLAANLEALIVEEGPETIGAFIAEPVMGAGGAVIPPKGYFAAIQKVLRKHDILFIADEVITGFGRTGNMWACETFDLEPDMISCAKALSAGCQPISGLLVNEKVNEALVQESKKLGNFSHGFTYGGHPVAAAVALETLKIYEEMDLVNHARRVGLKLIKGLESLSDHPLVGDARGIGLIAGVELVQDKASRTPFDPSVKIAEQVCDAAHAEGLIIRHAGDRLVFAPPLIITETEIGELLEKLERALDTVAATIN